MKYVRLMKYYRKLSSYVGAGSGFLLNPTMLHETFREAHETIHEVHETFHETFMKYVKPVKYYWRL